MANQVANHPAALARQVLCDKLLEACRAAYADDPTIPEHGAIEELKLYDGVGAVLRFSGGSTAQASLAPYETAVAYFKKRVAECGSQPAQLAALVTDMARLALLLHWSDAQIKAHDVFATLSTWGVDCDMQTAEIEAVLKQPRTLETLHTWSAEITFPGGQPASARSIDWQDRIAFRTLLATMPVGAKLDFATAKSIEGDTLRFPVDPTGVGFVRLRSSAARVKQLEIETTSQGFQISARRGGRGDVSLEGGARASVAGVLSGSISATARGGHGRSSGYTMKFQTQSSAIDYVDYIVTAKPTMEAIAKTKDAFRTNETTKLGDVSAGLRGGVGMSGKIATNYGLGMGLSGNVTCAFQINSKATQFEESGTQGSTKVTKKWEVSRTPKVSTRGTAGVGRTLFDASIGWSSTYTRKYKTVATLSTQPGSGTPPTHGAQVTSPVSAAFPFPSTVAPHTTYIEAELTEQTDHPVRLRVFAASLTGEDKTNFQELLQQMKAGDVIAVTYKILPQHLDEANRLVQAGRSAAAQSIFEQKRCFQPVKAILMSTSTWQERSSLSAIFLTKAHESRLKAEMPKASRTFSPMPASPANGGAP